MTLDDHFNKISLKYQKLKEQYPHIEHFLIALITLSSALVVYYSFSSNLDKLIRYWDGPNYLYIAKTLYNIPELHPFVPYQKVPSYYACHFPLYPLLIRLLHIVFSYPIAMLIATQITTIAATLMFYIFIREFKLVQNPFWSAVVSLFLPIRWLTYHSVGATEPLFIFLVVASFYLYKKDKIMWAFTIASVAGLCRIVGILLIPVFLLTLLREKKYKYIPFLAIIPMGVILLFCFYAFQFGDFWIYFKHNQSLIKPFPFLVFQSYSFATPPHAAELYFALYGIYGLGTFLLYRYPLIFSYCLTFWVFNLFIFHEDLSRYLLPISFFAIIVAYDQLFNQKSFKYLFVLLLLPLIIYYTSAVISQERYLVVPRVYQRLLIDLDYDPEMINRSDLKNE